MERTEDFILGEASNDLRHFIIGSISSKTETNNWKASITECKTNKEQDALFLSLSASSQFLETAKKDFNETIETAKKFFQFDFKLNGLSLEITNIK